MVVAVEVAVLVAVEVTVLVAVAVAVVVAVWVVVTVLVGFEVGVAELLARQRSSSSWDRFTDTRAARLRAFAAFIRVLAARRSWRVSAARRWALAARNSALALRSSVSSRERFASSWEQSARCAVAGPGS